jgi:hypothetical protein
MKISYEDKRRGHLYSVVLISTLVRIHQNIINTKIFNLTHKFKGAASVLNSNTSVVKTTYYTYKSVSRGDCE